MFRSEELEYSLTPTLEQIQFLLSQHPLGDHVSACTLYAHSRLATGNTVYLVTHGTRILVALLLFDHLVHLYLTRDGVRYVSPYWFVKHLNRLWREHIGESHYYLVDLSRPGIHRLFAPVFKVPLLTIPF